MPMLAPRMSETAMAAAAVGANTVTKVPSARVSSKGLMMKYIPVETTNWNSKSQKSNMVNRIVFTSNELNEKYNIKKMK